MQTDSQRGGRKSAAGLAPLLLDAPPPSPFFFVLFMPLWSYTQEINGFFFRDTAAVSPEEELKSVASQNIQNTPGR